MCYFVSYIPLCYVNASMSINRSARSSWFCPCHSFLSTASFTKPILPSIIPPSHRNKISKKTQTTLHLLWTEQMAWTRMIMISIAFDLPDESLTTTRLFRNALDMGSLFAEYCGKEKGDQLTKLLQKHLQMMIELVRSSKENAAEAEKIEHDWFLNAHHLADFLYEIHPYQPNEWVQQIFAHYLTLLKTASIFILSGHFYSSITIYDQIEEQALKLSSLFYKILLYTNKN